MIRRQCPKCKSDWYSANTAPWVCGKCGAELDNRHNKPLERRAEDAAINQLRWQKQGFSRLAGGAAIPERGQPGRAQKKKSRTESGRRKII